MVKALVLALLVSACGSEADVPAGSAHQLTVYGSTQGRSARVAVLVIDDAATDFGRALRQRVADDFVADYESSYMLGWESCREDEDPAVWYPAERFAVVVWPSRPLGQQIASFVTTPELSWSTEQYSESAAQQWSEAVAAAILRVETTDQGSYRPLEAQAYVVRLLLGQQPPASDDEQRLVDGMPADAIFDVYLATTRDDESPLVPSEYRVSVGGDASISLGSPRVFAPDENLSSCSTARVPWISEWAGEADQSVPCADVDLFQAGFVTDCYERCIARAPMIADDGSAACRVIAYTPGEEPCSAELGWLDPIYGDGRRPLTQVRYGITSRVCEVMQLEGAALDSCRNDLACTNCQPGWCATVVPELLGPCVGNGPRWPFRFTHGAATARDAELEIVCNTL